MVLRNGAQLACRQLWGEEMALWDGLLWTECWAQGWGWRGHSNVRNS